MCALKHRARRGDVVAYGQWESRGVPSSLYEAWRLWRGILRHGERPKRATSK